MKWIKDLLLNMFFSCI